MTNSHGYVLEYPRIRVDHFEQAPVPLPASLLAHRRSIAQGDLGRPRSARGESFAPGQTHFDKPLLYLLTHIHTDHLKGLDRPGITAPIYCSHATKQLLLKYERQKTRIEKDRHGVQTKYIGVVRPYAHLRVTDNHANAISKVSGLQSSSLDLLHPLLYNVPTKVQYTPTSTVTLTLIESNHMFGGTMFLIQGAHGAVLHTGDMRAEPWWCEALTRNPFLSPYLCWSKSNQDSTASSDAQAENWADHIESLGSNTSSLLQADGSSSQSQTESHSQVDPLDRASEEQRSDTSAQGRTMREPRKSHLRLRNIYLDTELLLCNHKVPTKQQASLDMVTLMRMYPSHTVFFLNCWTWGYEDMLVVTAKAFGCKIHVDRFKYSMYKAARTEAPFLADIVTQDHTKTRFHACEKRNVCPSVQSLASRYSSTAADPVLAREALAAHSQMDSSSADAGQRWGPFRSQPEPLLVYVNPAQVAADRWPGMFDDTKRRLEAAQRHETAWPEALVVPMERHSTLPELQMFVGLFRPRTVSPNTILDPKGGLDYYLLHHLFGHLLAGTEDRRKLADQGLLMLGDKTWSFYEAQLARAREQAHARRGGTGADAGGSTEAVRAASASLNPSGQSESVGESIDADQLEQLSRLRGISFKGLMMQNMAGNLAAMLEIERWRRAAGIQEPPGDLESVIEDTLAETQTKTDASVSSAGYDADHSQLAETQVFPSRPTSQAHGRSGRRDEATLLGAAVLAACAARPAMALDEASHASPGAIPTSPEPAPASAPPPSTHAELLTPQTQDSQSSAAEEHPTELTEDLAIRYVNVLIHHFRVAFNRTNASHVQMWKSIRRTLPQEAQKVEEHWFRETGVLPPLWISQVVEEGKGPDDQAVEASESAVVQQEAVTNAFGDILASFVDMLAPSSPIYSDAELVSASSPHDQTVALQLILRHLAKLGFHDRILADSSLSMPHASDSHGSCLGAERHPAIWSSLAVPLTELATHLASEFQSLVTLITDPTATSLSMENANLSFQVTGVICSYRPLNAVVSRTAMQALLERVICIVEAAPRDMSSLPKAKRRLVALACAVLRAEELDQEVLAPLEGRLLALVHDEDGVLRRNLESFEQSESGLSTASQPPPHQEHSEACREAQEHRAESLEQEFEQVNESPDEESSLLVRPPRIAAFRTQPLATLEFKQPPVQPCAPTIEPNLTTTTTTAEEDPIITSQTEAADDTIESISLAAVLDQSQGASSATQEEDSTQSEESQMESLPPARAGERTRMVTRTSSLPSFLHARQKQGPRERSKRRLDPETEAGASRITRSRSRR